MALDATKWQVQVNKAIRYIGPDHGAAGANYVTVLELHRWLQDLADDASVSNDDFMDITTVSPSDKKFDTIITLTNGYTLDDGYTTPASEMIYGGSIIQGSGGTEAIYDGIRVVSTRGVIVNVIQNGAVLFPTNKFWNSVPNGESLAGINFDAANGVAMQFMVKVRSAGADIDNKSLTFTTREWGKTYSEFRIPATGRGQNVVPLTFADDLNNATASATVATWDDVVNDRTDSTTTVSGVNAQGATTLNVVSGAAFSIGEYIAINDGVELGQYKITNIVANALTITPGLDVATVGGETIWKISYGFEAIDVDADTVNENYYFKWDRGSRTINQFYERMKYLTQRGTSNRLIGLSGDVFRGITHEITVDTPTGTFHAAEPVSWPGGTGQMFAINSTTAATKMWIQLLTGVAPTDNQTITGTNSSATVLVNVTVTERTISAPFSGASTGTALVGAYGFALESADLGVNDKITAFDGTTRQPPNNVTFTVNGVANGYRVLVGPEDGGGGLLYTQLSNTNLLNGVAVTSVVVDEAIPANTPTSGTIRIQRVDGSYTRHPYSAVNTGTKTFTITAHDFSTNNASIGANIFISYIDAAATGTSISYNTVQTTTQTLFIEARFGGTGPNYTDSIKPAKTTGTLGTTGGSATISAVSDA